MQANFFKFVYMDSVQVYEVKSMTVLYKSTNFLCHVYKLCEVSRQTLYSSTQTYNYLHVYKLQMLFYILSPYMSTYFDNCSQTYFPMLVYISLTQFCEVSLCTLSSLQANFCYLHRCGYRTCRCSQVYVVSRCTGQIFPPW